MKTNYLVFLILLFIGNHTIAQNSDYHPNKIIFRIASASKNNITIETITSRLESQKSIKTETAKPIFLAHNKNSFGSKKAHPISQIYEIHISDEKRLMETIHFLNQMPEIVYAEPLYTLQLLETPSDPYQNQQYYLPLISAFQAFDVSKGDSGVIIGIVDTGVDFYHEDLKASFKYNYNDTINGIDDDLDGFVDNYRGWDLGDNDNNPQSEYSHHGTFVSGMTSAVANNGVGITGIGYNTKILPVKVMNRTGSLSTAYQGIVYAADQGCQIINCSWGGTSPSQLCADVIDYAVNFKNCLVIAAAGNDKTTVPFYPASEKGVLSVAATDYADLKWNGSSYGIHVDICAPGSNVLSTYQNNTYIKGSGTSYASPLVAGAAALLKAFRPELTALQLAEQLRITSDIVDTLPDNQYFYQLMGYGRLNAFRALTVHSLPSIRIENIEFHSDNSNQLSLGDTLSVSFSAINYLASVSSCIIRLSSDSEYFTPISNTLSTGTIETLQRKEFNNSPIQFLVSKTIPANFNAPFTFEMRAPNTDGTSDGKTYSDYQKTNYSFNRTYVDIAANKITTTLTSNGQIGYQNLEDRTGKGFIYNNESNLLREGGIILAIDKDHVASSFYETTEFETLVPIDTFSVDNLKLIGKTTFQAKVETKLNVKIEQTTIAYKTEELESAIIHEYSISNNGIVDFNSLLMAVYVDWSIENAFSNEAAFDEDHNLFYTFTHSDQTMYAGICLLNAGKAVPYGFDLTTGGNGGMDIITDFTNEEKWFTMNNARPKAGNNGDSINIATQLTAGPFSVASGDSIKISWALIAAKNLYELTDIARTLTDQYQLDNKDIKTPTKFYSLYPNPAEDIVYIEHKTLESEISIQIFNNTGVLIKELTGSNKLIEINTRDLEPGLYFIKISEGSNYNVDKLIIMH